MHYIFRMRSENKKLREKNEISKKKFMAKTQYLSLKAPCDNVKMQLQKNYTTQIYFS